MSAYQTKPDISKESISTCMNDVFGLHISHVYEHIAEDIAAYAEQMFGMQGSAGDCAEGLRQVMELFLPKWCGGDCTSIVSGVRPSLVRLAVVMAKYIAMTVLITGM